MAIKLFKHGEDKSQFFLQHALQISSGKWLSECRDELKVMWKDKGKSQEL